MSEKEENLHKYFARNLKRLLKARGGVIVQGMLHAAVQMSMDGLSDKDIVEHLCKDEAWKAKIEERKAEKKRQKAERKRHKANKQKRRAEEEKWMKAENPHEYFARNLHTLLREKGVKFVKGMVQAAAQMSKDGLSNEDIVEQLRKDRPKFIEARKAEEKRLKDEMEKWRAEAEMRQQEEARMQEMRCIYRAALRAAKTSYRAEMVDAAISTGLPPTEAAEKIREQEIAARRREQRRLRQALQLADEDDAKRIKENPRCKVCKTTLARRKWRPAEIAKLLPDPEEARNPHYACAAPMLLWRLVDVVVAEARRDKARAK